MAKTNPDAATGGTGPTTALDDQSTSAKSLFTRQVKVIILLLIAANVAFFLAGFGTFLDQLQPYTLRAFPLYVFCAVLLLVLQGQIISGANQARMAQRQDKIKRIRWGFIFITSLIPLLYAGWARFFGGPDNFLAFPWTYFILNVVALAGFGYEIASFRFGDRDRFYGGDSSNWASKQPITTQESTEIDLGPLVPKLRELAAEAASLAGFCLLAAIILSILSTGIELPFQLGILSVKVDISWLPLFRGKTLQDFDIDLFALALFVTIFFYCIVAALIATKVETFSFFQRVLVDTIQSSAKHAARSFLSAVSPVIWMLPAFLIAAFALRVTSFFRESAATPLSHGVIDLISPLNPNNLSHIGSGTFVLVLAAASVVGVLGALLFAEFDPIMISEIKQHMVAVGRVLVVLLPLFLTGLMASNVLLYNAFGAPVPFQLLIVTAISILVVFAFGIFSLWQRARKQAQ